MIFWWFNIYLEKRLAVLTEAGSKILPKFGLHFTMFSLLWCLNKTVVLTQTAQATRCPPHIWADPAHKFWSFQKELSDNCALSSLRVSLENLKSLLLFLVFVVQVIQRGLEDVFVGFEACDDLLGSLVFPLEVGKFSLDCLFNYIFCFITFTRKEKP